jgi:flavodoxin
MYYQKTRNMKTIVYYYSHKGSNRFLANRIADDLNCEFEEIKPRVNSHLLMLMGLNFGNRKLKTRIEEYEKVILCGPIWIGKLIIPLKNFINANSRKIGKLIFVTCCGSSFKEKDNKFGHNLVFDQVKRLLNDKCLHCEAFPIDLVAPEGLENDPNAFMKVHLNNNTFSGKIIPLYNAFLEKINTQTYN